MTWDAVVLGGGPSGAMAALSLAKGGARVLVLEKCPLPRFKLCSGVLSGYSQDLAACALGTGLGGTVVGGTRRTHILYGGRSFPLTHTDLKYVDRARFDAALLERATAVGAVVRDGARVISACHLTSHWEVQYEISGGRQNWVEAHLVVEARGSESKLAHDLQTEEIVGLGVEAVVPYDGSNDAMLDWSMPGIGYFWLFAHSDGTAGVGGATIQQDLWPELRRRIADFWAGKGIRTPAKMPGHRMRYSLGAVARGGLYLVGEAAGAQDPVLGEGIRWALKSGQLAAQAILSGGGEAEYTHLYARHVRREISARRLPAAIGAAVRYPTLWQTVLRAPVAGGALIGHFLG